MLPRLRHGLVAAAAGLPLAACAGSPSTLDPRGPAAARIADLWWVMLTLATAVVIVVTVLLLYGLLRRRTGREAAPVAAAGGDRFGHGLIAIGGVAVPFVVLVVLLLLTLRTLRALPAPDAAGDLTVEITGRDWWWEVRYPESGIVTANEITIPAGRQVTFKVTSGDVIHSFWVPQLNGKIDAIPGRVNTIALTADAPGVYRGQCAEYCGVQHAHMAFTIIARPPQEFAAWLEAQRRPPPQPSGQLLAGQQVFLSSTCIACHAVAGTSANGRVGPNLTHLASRATIAAGTLENTRANLAAWIRDPAAFKPGVNMPAFSFSAQDMEALVAYLESLK